MGGICGGAKGAMGGMGMAPWLCDSSAIESKPPARETVADIIGLLPIGAGPPPPPSGGRTILFKRVFWDRERARSNPPPPFSLPWGGRCGIWEGCVSHEGGPSRMRLYFSIFLLGTDSLLGG